MDVSSQFFPIIGNGLALYEYQEYPARDNIPFVGESGVSKLTGLEDSMIVFALESSSPWSLEPYFLYLLKIAITIKGIKKIAISAVVVRTL